MAEPRVYLKCSAKEKVNQYGPRLVVGVRATELIAFAEAHANERGFVNLVISPRREPSAYGDTHSVMLDTYIKSSGREGTVTTPRQEVSADGQTATWRDDDPPF